MSAPAIPTLAASLRGEAPAKPANPQARKLCPMDGDLADGSKRPVRAPVPIIRSFGPPQAPDEENVAPPAPTPRTPLHSVPSSPAPAKPPKSRPMRPDPVEIAEARVAARGQALALLAKGWTLCHAVMEALGWGESATRKLLSDLTVEGLVVSRRGRGFCLANDVPAGAERRAEGAAAGARAPEPSVAPRAEVLELKPEARSQLRMVMDEDGAVLLTNADGVSMMLTPREAARLDRLLSGTREVRR